MGNRSYRKKPSKQADLAMQSARELIEQAGIVFKSRPQFADRYAKLCRKIAMKHKLRLPPEIKRKICKGCDAFLVPGKTARIRTQRGHVVIYCTSCKRISRIGYKKKSLDRR